MKKVAYPLVKAGRSWRDALPDGVDSPVMKLLASEEIRSICEKCAVRDTGISQRSIDSVLSCIQVVDAYASNISDGLSKMRTLSGKIKKSVMGKQRLKNEFQDLRKRVLKDREAASFDRKKLFEPDRKTNSDFFDRELRIGAPVGDVVKLALPHIRKELLAEAALVPEHPDPALSRVEFTAAEAVESMKKQMVQVEKVREHRVTTRYERFNMTVESLNLKKQIVGNPELAFAVQSNLQSSVVGLIYRPVNKTF